MEGGTVNRAQLVSCIAGLVVVAMAAGPAAAQSAADNTLELRLHDALRVALENNLELVGERVDPQIALQQVEIEGSVFDATFGAEIQYTDSSADGTASDPSVPGADASVTNEFEQLTGGLNLSQLLNFGATYTLSYTPDDQTTFNENVNQTLNLFEIRSTDSLNNRLALSYTMPLLKNFGRAVNTERLVLARSNVEISKEDLRSKAIEVMEDVEGAYWDVVAGVENVRTAQLALKRAEDLLELNRKKVEVGTLAPIEITQAEAGVASQEEGVIVAETTLLEVRRLRLDSRVDLHLALGGSLETENES